MFSVKIKEKTQRAHRCRVRYSGTVFNVITRSYVGCSSRVKKKNKRFPKRISQDGFSKLACSSRARTMTVIEGRIMGTNYYIILFFFIFRPC